MRYPYLPAKDIVRAAEGLLTRAFGAEIPVPVDLETILFDVLAEEEQLAFDDERVLGRRDGDRILGQMWPFRNRIEICASLRDPRGKGRRMGRYRFTAAHEIGHWVLHRPLHLQSDTGTSHGLFGPTDARDRMISLHRNVFATEPVSLPEEVQANRFAASLLIPASGLGREFARRFGPPPVTTNLADSVHATATDLAQRTTRSVGTSLCDCFEVSRHAMAIALESGGYVTDQPTLL